MDETFWRLIAGVAAATAVAAYARRRRALSPRGGIAAVLVGGAVVAGGGWWSGMLLVVFFATSSALSRAGRVRDEALAVRGNERDAVQVLSNGGVAAALALATMFLPSATHGPLLGGVAGAIAAATADTWATELGRRSRTPPRLIVGGGPVPPGTSGGVTALGTLAAAAGAALIGGFAALGAALGWTPGDGPAVLLGTTVAGVAGALFDSVLGATVQAAYHCPACDRPTEHRIHPCGARTRLARGHPAITNDVVNLGATLAGALVGVASRLL